MKSLTPRSKIILIVITTIIASYALIDLIVSRIKNREQLVHQESAKIIQQEISERFNLVLDVTLVIGQLSPAYLFGQQNNGNEELVYKIIAEKKYILGLNQLNAEGRIISIYPKQLNQEAMGKISQNYSELLKSYQRGEKYWFSPPFELFQGGTGFVFYIPIVVKEKLLGWMAPVISSQLFFEHFRKMDFFDQYELIIKDELTGNSYFGTGILPTADKVQEIKSNIRGRSITFLSWPKATSQHFEFSFMWKCLISLIIGFIGGLITTIYYEKKKAYARLENISDLLKLTSNEALSKLMDIQTEYLSLGVTGYLSTAVVEKDVQSVTNLIEQIELLQNIAGSENYAEETFEILPELKIHIEELQEVVKKKHLNLNLNAESFNDIKVTGNKWLISNTVLKNAVSYCALISRPSGKIDIFHTISSHECCTVFRVEKVYENIVHKAFKTERRLLVARNIMDLLNGTIIIREDGPESMILKLIIRT